MVYVCHTRELATRETIRVGGFDSEVVAGRVWDKGFAPVAVCVEGDDTQVVAVLSYRGQKRWQLDYQTPEYMVRILFSAVRRRPASDKAIRHMHYHLNGGRDGKLIRGDVLTKDRVDGGPFRRQGNG